jgi:hypothetical protein
VLLSDGALAVAVPPQAIPLPHVQGGVVRSSEFCPVVPP